MDSNEEDEATNISKSVLSDVLSQVIEKSSNEDDCQSLITALESLTEESAKEIFENDTPEKVSAKTSKIIARFMGRTKGPRTPTPPIITRLQNLSEITFSSDESNDEQLVINWDNIDSPNDKASTEATETSHKVMHEVVDEIFEEPATNDDAPAEMKASANVESGRRKKSKPKKKSIDVPKDNSEEIAQDVDQIVEFLKQGQGNEDVQQQEQNEVTKKTPAAPLEEAASPPLLKKKQKRFGRKRKGRRRKNKMPPKAISLTETSVSAVVSPMAATQVERPSLKPLQNWSKLLKLSSENPLPKSTVDQVFRDLLTPYVPKTGPKEALEPSQCPGCSDSFLLPTTFFQHVYRRSCVIRYNCDHCQVSLSFYNRCHFRIHVLSHLEVEGLHSLDIKGSLDVSPLTSSELNICTRDNLHDQLEHLYKDYQVQHSDSYICTECKLPTTDLRSHFTTSNEEPYECSQCKMWLPSKCSLSAHRRIHQGLPRHVCPECGMSFETWHLFKHHVQGTCAHESRHLSIHCLLCLRKKKATSCWINSSSILAHFYESHIALLYKCSDCPKAYADKLEVYQHRQASHKPTDSLRPEFDLLYKASFLKGPLKLFATRKACEERIMPLIKKWKRQFKFKCFACHNDFEDAQGLASHDMTWCQMINGGGKKDGFPACSKVFNTSEDPLPAASSASNKQSDKMKQHLDELEALSNCCGSCEKLQRDFRGHYLLHHNKPASSADQTPMKRDDSVMALRITRKRLEATSDASQSSSVELIKEPASFPPEPKKPRKGKQLQVKSFVESLGKDVLSERHLLSFNRIDKKALVFGATSSCSKAVKAGSSQVKKCALCDFVSPSSDKFAAHIRIHLDDLNGDCLQCRECGMCFASEASWKKHLFLLHRIKKPQLSDYCQDL